MVDKVKFAPWPSIEQDELDAVEKVLRSGKLNYWTGDEGRLFEKEFADFVACRHAIALANGTVALEAALKSLGVGPGDEVIVPSRTFIATASSVVMCGARPVVADVDKDSQNLTAETIAAVLTPASKAVITVHLAGWPCDMDPILELARKYNLKVIEDCAQALGARYKDRPVGSLGDVAAFSFCQDKIMTTGGEGGMLVTNSSELWERAWSYKDHGKSYDAVYRRKHPPGFGFKWLHESFGTNWRMTEMQSAIGRVYLRKLSQWVEKRRENSARLFASFQNVRGLRVPVPSDSFYHSYYKFYAFIRPEALLPNWDLDRILIEINAAGVPCICGSCSEIYLEKAFDAEKLKPAQRLPIAKQLGETSLMFLVHPTLDDLAIETTIDSACAVFNKAFSPY